MARRRFGSTQRRSAAGQGGMRAQYSGNAELIRHTVDVALNSGGLSNLEDQKARAFPLLVYTGASGNSVSDPGNSSSPGYAEGSRVNYMQVQLQIAQSDTTKPNNCYVGFISTSFSDAMLNSANMTSNFNDLIAQAAGTNDEGYMVTYNGAKDMTINEYMGKAKQRHWIRGLAKNQYTLYSGRPAILDAVLPVPRKNKRGQFGSGWWIVLMNDSSDLQNVSGGSGTDIHVSLKTFFKEIPQLATPVTA
jgi:hypothetical protein